jgi:hypothetical protein
MSYSLQDCSPSATVFRRNEANSQNLLDLKQAKIEKIRKQKNYISTLSHSDNSSL